MKLVHITTPGGHTARIGHGTTVVTDDGRELHGIRAINVRIAPDEIVRADLEMMCAFEGHAAPRFCVLNPNTGRYQAVKRIEFDDGSVFDVNA